MPEYTPTSAYRLVAALNALDWAKEQMEDEGILNEKITNDFFRIADYLENNIQYSKKENNAD